MRTFTFRCTNPKCRQILEIPEDLRGLRARCAKCGQSFPVPLSVRHLLAPPAGSELKRKAG
jgi:hypothetical protein